jgi:DNA-binding transcriptional regulator YbjK
VSVTENWDVCPAFWLDWAIAFRPETNRPSTLARREALLTAAAELVAERGVSGVTHRAVAARAGLPLSATSYFFASIDELVLEALRVFMGEFIARLDLLAAAISEQHLAPADAADLVVRALLASPQPHVVAQFEAYLEVTRRPEPPPEVKQAIAALERLARAALTSAGATRPAEGARAFVAMADGFALHRLAWPRARSDRTALRQALLSLFIAYTMDADERAGWDARLRQPPPGA